MQTFWISYESQDLLERIVCQHCLLWGDKLGKFEITPKIAFLGLFELDENMVLLAMKPNLGKIQWFWALYFNSNSGTDLQLQIPFIGMNFMSEFKSETKYWFKTEIPFYWKK